MSQFLIRNHIYILVVFLWRSLIHTTYICTNIHLLIWFLTMEPSLSSSFSSCYILADIEPVYPLRAAVSSHPEPFFLPPFPSALNVKSSFGTINSTPFLSGLYCYYTIGSFNLLLFSGAGKTYLEKIYADFCSNYSLVLVLLL